MQVVSREVRKAQDVRLGGGKGEVLEPGGGGQIHNRWCLATRSR